MKVSDAEKWLKRLVGERYIEPKEESQAMESWQYGDPANVLERKQGMKKARDRKINRGGGR